MAEKFLVKVDHSSFITQSQNGKFSLTTNKQNANSAVHIMPESECTNQHPTVMAAIYIAPAVRHTYILILLSLRMLM